MEIVKELHKRKYRIVLLRCFNAFKVVVHTIFVILDILSDIFYLSTVNFYNMALKGLCILFIFIIPAIIYSLTLAFLVFQIIKLKRDGEEIKKISSFTCLWFFFGPALSLIYPAIEKVEIFAPSEYDWLFQLATIEFLMESLPQLLIQGINNSLEDAWNSGTKFSFTISVMSLLRGCYVLSTTWYRRQYEKYLNGIEKDVIDEVKSSMLEGFGDIEDTQCIDELIAYKFYEQFLSKKVIFNRKFDKDYKENKKVHKDIENIIYEIYKRETKLRFKFSKMFEKLSQPINVLIIMQILLNFVVWFCNLLYLIIADFEKESLRFLLMFFLSLGYVSSLAGSFKDLKGTNFRRFLIFRLCVVSHFDNLVKLVFNISIESNNKVLFEILPLLICWIPVITIEGVNYNSVNKKDGIYRAVIVLNVLCIVLIFFRIIYIFVLWSGLVKVANIDDPEPAQAEKEKTTTKHNITANLDPQERIQETQLSQSMRIRPPTLERTAYETVRSYSYY